MDIWEDFWDLSPPISSDEDSDVEILSNENSTPAPSSDEEEEEEIFSDESARPIINLSQRSVTELLDWTLAGILPWIYFSSMKNEVVEMPPIRLMSPFNLKYLALKVWFNSAYWDDAVYEYFRHQSVWDSFFYQLRPRVEGLLEQQVYEVNIPIANIIKNQVRNFEICVKKEIDLLKPELKNQFRYGFFSKTEYRLINNPFRKVKYLYCCTEAPVEINGFYHFIEEDDYKRYDYDFKQKRFLLKKMY